MCRHPIADLLDSWLARVAEPTARTWLDRQVGELGGEASPRTLALAFSGAVRRFPKTALALDETDLATAASVLPGWHPADWNAVRSARSRLLLALRSLPAAELVARLDDLAATADCEEAVALYGALALLPHGSALVARARIGLRSSIDAVFTAVACDNPFPATHFDEEAWNQMVLKAFFIGADVDRIHGLDERRNDALARMLSQYARERQAASRPVDERLWRLATPTSQP